MTTPAPMTPADCDLRAYEWMPLFGARLFTSHFEAHASDLAFRVAVRLYWASWQQVPAASLPNDDIALCRLAGLARDLKTWHKLRAEGVLHGFILCADDRLYHRLIADEAIKAWESRQHQQAQRDYWRDKKRRQRDNGTNGGGENVPRDIQGDNGDCPEGRPEGVSRDVPEMSPFPPTPPFSDSTVQDSTRQKPPRSPPAGRGGAARRGDVKIRNGFHVLDGGASAGVTIDATEQEMAHFREFHGKRRGISDG